MSDIISDYMRNIGAKGGKATASSLTSKQRSANASKAAKARWKTKKRRKP